MDRNKSIRYRNILCILLFLFLFRVSMQFILQFAEVSFLPGFDKWHSNTLPYELLLICQIIILFVYGRICLRVGNNTLKSKKSVYVFLLIFGCIYFISMLMRYSVTMYLHPEMRWTGHLIPIVFHLVLASFLIVLGLYQRADLKSNNS